MSNTISKNFKDSEIKGVMYIDGKKVLYLKEGVKRRRYIEDTIGVDESILESHLNTQLLNYQKWEKFYKRIIGVDDYANEN